MTKRSRSDWVAAGVAHITATGQPDMPIAVIGARLGATKGSFYWHFPGLDAYRVEVARAFGAECEQRLAPSQTSQDPLETLLCGFAPPGLAEQALRQLAWSDAQVAAIIERIDRRRISAIGEVLTSRGQDALRLPRLIYASWLGAGQLAGALGTRPVKLYRAAAQWAA